MLHYLSIASIVHLVEKIRPKIGIQFFDILVIESVIALLFSSSSYKLLLLGCCSVLSFFCSIFLLSP